MARKPRELVYYKETYLQGSMSDEAAQLIVSLDDYSEVQELKHIITNMPDHIIDEFKKSAEAHIKKNKTYAGFDDSVYREQAGIGTLRPAQTIGAAHMYYAGSMVLGDQVGTGKTVEVAALIRILMKEYASEKRKFRYVFLAEKTSAAQLRDKLMKFTGEFVGLLPSGTQPVVTKFISQNPTGMNYSIVGTHALIDNPDFLVYLAENQVDLVIVDESSICKNTTSSAYSNLKALFKYTERKILLNATALETNLREVYNQLTLCDPHFMPTVADFSRVYEIKKRDHWGRHGKVTGYKNSDVFKEEVKLRYLSRNRQSEGAEYRDNKPILMLVALTKEQKRLIKLTSMDRMVVDYPPGIDRYLGYNEETTMKLRALCHLLDNVIDAKRNATMVYCHYIDCQQAMLEYLQQKGYRCVILNGGVKKTTDREEIARDFNIGLYDVIITNVQKGLDLKNCDNGIMYSIDPNPAKMVQFEGRMTREIDIIGKSLYMLVSMGKEKKRVERDFKVRLEASIEFTNAGISMVSDSVMDKENVMYFGFDEDELA